VVIHYDIVKHKGTWAVSIDGVIYDDPKLFEKNFPRAEYAETRFVCEFDFSWDEMYQDMVAEWSDGEAA
jgi:hypothetical protein